jgi:hypothetical protein
LLLGLGGCLDVPALSFQAVADGGRNDMAGGDAAPTVADARSIPDVPGQLPKDAFSGRDDDNPDTAIVADAHAQPDGGDAWPTDGARPGDAAEARPDAAVLADARPDEADLPAVRPLPDAGPPFTDAASPGPDAASPGPDAAQPPADAAQPPADAAVPPPDAAVPPPDAAVPPPDAAVPPLVAALSVPGSVTGRRFGAAVAIVPDQSRDGFADVLVGAPRSGPRGGAAASALHLIDGVTGVELSSYVERDDPNDFGSAFVAAAFAPDRDGWQVIAGAKGANGGAGRLSAYALPGLRRVDVVEGQVAGANLGQTVAPAFEDGRPLVMVSTPGIVIAPRMTIFSLRAVGNEGFSLEQRQRVDADVPIASKYGINLLGVPTPQGGGLDDFVAVGESGLIPTRRVMRYRSGGTAEFRSEYVTPDSDLTTGTSLLEIPGAPPKLAVGTPGLDDGKVAVFVRDGGDNEVPLFEITPMGPAGSFGSSLALAPLLTAPGDASPVVCIGAPGRAAVAGRVECRAVGAEGEALTLPSPANAAGFGRALSIATVRDPDGSWLIAVGAPETEGPDGLLGGVVLHRVTTPP